MRRMAPFWRETGMFFSGRRNMPLQNSPLYGDNGCCAEARLFLEDLTARIHSYPFRTGAPGRVFDSSQALLSSP